MNPNVNGNPVKPGTGDWPGIYVPLKGNHEIPITIRFARVDDDGSIQGSINLAPDSASKHKVQAGAFSSANYSQFGTLHFELDVIEGKEELRDQVIFDGRFEMPTMHHGVLYGTVLVRSAVNGADGRFLQTGTLSAVYGAGLVSRFAESVWDDARRVLPR